MAKTNSDTGGSVRCWLAIKANPAQYCSIDISFGLESPLKAGETEEKGLERVYKAVAKAFDRHVDDATTRLSEALFLAKEK